MVDLPAMRVDCPVILNVNFRDVAALERNSAMIGFRRSLAVVGVVLMCVLAGMTVTAGSAAASSYQCGSQCNGHQPGWAIPSNGIQCSHSDTVVKSGHPWYNDNRGVRHYETHTTMYLHYSTVCQTIWMVVKTDANFGRTECSNLLNRYEAPNYSASSKTCDSPGHPHTTIMVNDANGGKVAAAAYYGESTASHDWAVQLYY